MIKSLFFNFPIFLILGFGSNLEEEDPERPKRGMPIRIKARVPVRRNGREVGLASAAPILESVENSGSHSLQDLGQIRRAIQVQKNNTDIVCQETYCQRSKETFFFCWALVSVG
jgi:hypothetical protein